jgi:hypothetical protein
MYIRLLLVIVAILVVTVGLRIKESVAAPRPVYQQAHAAFVMSKVDLSRG